MFLAYPEELRQSKRIPGAFRDFVTEDEIVAHRKRQIRPTQQPERYGRAMQQAT